MIVLLFALTSLVNGNGKELYLTEDSRAQWKIITRGKLEKYEGEQVKIIHFMADLTTRDKDFLQIKSKSNFYLFINSSLSARGHYLNLSADSLRKKYGKSIFVSLYQEAGINNLTTHWMGYKTRNQFDNPQRAGKHFQNFVILATLLVIILFTALLRFNPQLTLDYLNIIKLFSFKPRDDSQFVLRITSSVNLLFYLFCSLLTSLAILIALHNAPELSVSIDLESMSTGELMVRWFLISLLVVGVLMLKLGLASIMTMLFAWKDTAGFQFFNFVRVLVVSLIFIGVIGIFSFSMNINLNYYFLVKCFCIMLSVGAGLMFFKLLNRESASPFHLFSYLCATEIFPLVILIKVFLF